MATPTNLYQYYTGQGKALPTVNQNAQTYQQFGLGNAGGYSGSAAQNTALLSKLMGAPTPSSSNGGGGGGYAQTPAGQPQPVSNDPGYNDETTLANKQATDLNDFTAKQQGTIGNAYQNASQQTGLQGYADTMNQIRNSLNAQQNAAAEAPVNAVRGAAGTFAGADNIQAQKAVNSMIPDELVAKLSANLVPAENAYQSAQQATGHISDNIVSSSQLAMAGFTSGQQGQLKALQDKVARGQQLTDQEFSRETQLSQAHIQAQAQIQSAGISAGATTSAARISANASTTNTTSNNLNSLNAAAIALGQGYSSYADMQKKLANGGTPVSDAINAGRGGQGGGSPQLQGSGASNYGWNH